MRPSVYLAGPITGLAYDTATDWREEARAWLVAEGIDAFSPLRHKHWLKGDPAIDGGPVAFANGHPLSRPKGICTRDRFDVARCDAVLMYLLGATKVSIGTMIEVGWADAYRKPIVLVVEPHVIRNPHHHAMVEQLVGYVHHGLPDALETVRALLLP